MVDKTDDNSSKSKIFECPKIGLRTIKSSIAVLICLTLNPKDPFFSCLTSLMCIQGTMDNTFKVAKNRVIGTILGATVGIVTMIIFKNVIVGIDNEIIKRIIINLFIALSIIITIHSNNIFLKMPGAVTVSCTAVLAVTTTHAFADPYHYAINRTLQTLLGVVIGLIVNTTINPPKMKKKEAKEKS